MNEVMLRTPQVIAVEINNIKDQTKKMVLFNSIEIGRRLVEAKSMLEHGDWGNWLEQSVDYSQRTANNLMKIFEEYGSNQIALFGDNAKSQALANLSYTQAVALLGIPQDEREQFIEENDIENLSTRELQKAIKERDEALEKLENAKRTAIDKCEEAQKLLEEKQRAEADARLSEQVLRTTQEDVKNLQEALKKAKESSKQEIEKLQISLKEAKESGNEESINDLEIAIGKAEIELENANNKIADLEKQLKEKPIEVPATIEKIPEEVELELNELRKKAQELESDKDSNKAILKFTVYFESLVSEFKELLGALGEIMEEEAKEKYKNAVKGLLGKMSERL